MFYGGRHGVFVFDPPLLNHFGDVLIVFFYDWLILYFQAGLLAFTCPAVSGFLSLCAFTIFVWLHAAWTCSTVSIPGWHLTDLYKLLDFLIIHTKSIMPIISYIKRRPSREFRRRAVTFETANSIRCTNLIPSLSHPVTLEQGICLPKMTGLTNYKAWLEFQMLILGSRISSSFIVIAMEPRQAWCGITNSRRKSRALLYFVCCCCQRRMYINHQSCRVLFFFLFES